MGLLDNIFKKTPGESPKTESADMGTFVIAIDIMEKGSILRFPEGKNFTDVSYTALLAAEMARDYFWKSVADISKNDISIDDARKVLFVYAPEYRKNPEADIANDPPVLHAYSQVLKEKAKEPEDMRAYR